AAGVIGMIGVAECENCKDKPDCRLDQFFKVVRFIQNGIPEKSIILKGKKRIIGMQYPDVGAGGEDFNQKGRLCGPCCLGKKPKDPCCCSKRWVYWSHDVPGFHKAGFRVKCDDEKCREPEISARGFFIDPSGDNQTQKKTKHFTFGYSAVLVINFKTQFSCKGGTTKPVTEWGIAVSYTFPKNVKGTGTAGFKFLKRN